MELRNWMRSVALPLLLLLCSCNNFRHTKLATFDVAMSRGSRVQDPLVIHANATPPNLPGCVAYATVHGDFHSGSEEYQALQLKKHASTLGFRPDFMIYAPQGAAFAGTVSTYVGFGITTSSPTYRPQGVAICFRETGFSTGMVWDERLMVTELSESARGVGILEGDTLVSIDGASMAAASGQLSAWHLKAMQHKPGDKVPVVWIRPGTGRMEGTLLLQPPTEWPPIRSFTTDYEARVKAAAGADRNPVWSGR
jgi:hypothetical protein